MSRKRREKGAPGQTTFFPPPPDLKHGTGLAEPRLWVRRLRLWHDFADDDPVRGRNIPFVRGLNIVSSPAGPADQVSTGHAAGKTLLCRQIRFCLGEDTFADPEDTAAIRARFPNGGVGAEVRLCGETWVVRRAFASRTDDRALRAENLDALADDSFKGTFATFRDAIEALAFTDANRELVKELPEIDFPWQYVLAWLTRDQECRLDGLTHWRHPESSSHSPVRKAAGETRLNVLRMVLGLYSEKSNAARIRMIQASHAADIAESEARQADERFRALRRELATGLELEESALWPPPAPSREVVFHDDRAASEKHLRGLQDRVDGRIVAARGVPDQLAVLRDEKKRAALENASAEHAEVEQNIANLDEEIRRARAHLELLSADSARAWASLRQAKHPTCPYDDTPLDLAKAKFVCPMPRLPDPNAAKKLAQESDAHRKSQEEYLAEKATKLGQLKGVRARLKARMRGLESDLEASQRAVAEAQPAYEAALTLRGTLKNFSASLDALDAARGAAKKAKEAEKLTADRKNEHLSTYSTSELTRWFDTLVTKVVAKEAQGEVTLDGKGLHAQIKWRGRRRSVALNSLRIVLFDLAALFCSVEGSSSAPAFLVHDSPREGDLDPWTYARLFETALALGPDEETAPFQYIVTTTTEPPAGDVRERVRVELSARADETRFFKVDL